MISQELLGYIGQQTAAGVATADIRHALITSGWDQATVDAALSGRTAGNAPTPAAVPAATQLSQSDAAAQVERMGRFKASWLLLRQSAGLLGKDKEILLFPVCSGVFLTIQLLLFVAVISFIEWDQYEDSIVDVLLYGALFVYYVGAYFILTFFRVALTAVVYERINGSDIGFRDGVSRAKSIGGKLFAWSLIAATVGIILKIISDRSKWLGKLVASLLGVAWNIATMFIAPTLLLDNVSVTKSIKNSANVFKQTWGESIILNVSLSLIQTIVIFGLVLFYISLALLLASAGVGVFALVAVAVLGIVTLSIAIIIFSTLEQVFRVALYSYARFGVIAEGFSPELIVGAAKSK
jgi:hypothetical protein